MDQVYLPLTQYLDKLQLKGDDTILVPLCGKSMDIQWLLNKGFKVIGVEVSEKAITELRNTLDLNFTKHTKGQFKIYKSDNLQLWLGDFLKMQPSFLPELDAIYDKAALIALPPEKRKIYAKSIKNLCSSTTHILLNCFEYPQESMSGPPFAVFKEELESLYGEQFSIELIHQQSMLDELSKFKQRGLKDFLDEKVYLLTPKKE